LAVARAADGDPALRRRGEAPALAKGCGCAAAPNPAKCELQVYRKMKNGGTEPPFLLLSVGNFLNRNLALSPDAAAY
jgi:hypothetical protein